jgi:ferredoxin
MLWFLRGLRRGVLTTRYPSQLDAWASELPSPPAFRSQLLTEELVERMASACPSGALRRDGDALVLDLGACTACGRCAEVGGEAVRPSGASLLAADRRDSLRKRVAIAGGRGRG